MWEVLQAVAVSLAVGASLLYVVRRVRDFVRAIRAGECTRGCFGCSIAALPPEHGSGDGSRVSRDSFAV